MTHVDMNSKPLSIEKRSHKHRSTIRKMVWAKVIGAILIMIAGSLLPYFLKLYYMPYLGVSMVFGGLLLLIQSFRTLKPYRKVSLLLKGDRKYDPTDLSLLHSTITESMNINQMDRRMSQVLMVASIVAATLTVLSSSEVVIAASFIPLALVFGIEFSFLLLVLFVQKEYVYFLDKA